MDNDEKSKELLKEKFRKAAGINEPPPLENRPKLRETTDLLRINFHKAFDELNNNKKKEDQ